MRARIMAAIQGTTAEDGTKCDECGAVIFGEADVFVAFAEHDDDCMVGVHVAALYMLEHITGNSSAESEAVVAILKAQKAGES